MHLLPTFIDFFFRKTFSPFVETTLNSILPEKVAVRDLEKTCKISKTQYIKKTVYNEADRKEGNLETSSNKIETCSSSSQSLPLKQGWVLQRFFQMAKDENTNTRVRNGRVPWVETQLPLKVHAMGSD